MKQEVQKASSSPSNGRWYGIFLLSAALAIVADCFSKMWVEASLFLGESNHIWGPLSFTHIINPAGAWGMAAPRAVWIGVSFAGIAVVIALLLYFRHSTSRRLLAAISLGILFGGTFGNLLDRLFSDGVTDFVDIHMWGSVDWPTFNLADVAIVIGAGLLSFVFLCQGDQSKTCEMECNPSEHST